MGVAAKGSESHSEPVPNSAITIKCIHTIQPCYHEGPNHWSDFTGTMTVRNHLIVIDCHTKSFLRAAVEVGLLRNARLTLAVGFVDFRKGRAG